ncbi:hypothetical protein BHE74_00020656 [Ensete ventricosum]|nr:hypothetical protein BHE74_00020656 [Ensete ventricosum]
MYVGSSESVRRIGVARLNPERKLMMSPQVGRSASGELGPSIDPCEKVEVRVVYGRRGPSPEEKKRRVDGASFQCKRGAADGGTGGSSPPATAGSASFASTSTVPPPDPRRHDASPRLPRLPSLRQHRSIPSLLATTVNVDPSLPPPARPEAAG